MKKCDCIQEDRIQKLEIATAGLDQLILEVKKIRSVMLVGGGLLFGYLLATNPSLLAAFKVPV